MFVVLSLKKFLTMTRFEMIALPVASLLLSVPIPRQNFATLDQRHQDVSEHVRRLFDTVREQASGAQQQFGALNEQMLHQMDATRRLQDIIASLAQQQQSSQQSSQPDQSPAMKRIAAAAAAKELGAGAEAADSGAPAGMQQQFDALAQELEVRARVCVFVLERGWTVCFQNRCSCRTPVCFK